jgi:hypothetical protein
VWALALALVLLAGCGKKGPPLAPLVKVPARVERFDARRLGSVVYLQVTLPDRNQDGSSPADIVRLEIFGYTGEPPTMADFFKHGTLVASLPVRRPPEPERATPSGGHGKAAGSPPAKATVPPRVEAGFDQGATVVVTETLVPALLVPVAVTDVRRPRAPQPASKLAPPLLGPPSSEIAGRAYIAVGYNHRGKRSAPSVRVVVPVAPAPDPPSALVVTYTPDRFKLAWMPPAATRRPALEPASGGTLPSKLLVEALPASAYNVYEVEHVSAAPGAGQAPTPAAVRMPTPVNETPLTAPAFEDPRFAFGVERCYVVRTVDTIGPHQTVESAPSSTTCVTPRDTFAPAAPTDLKAVAGEGAVSLNWEPSAEADLAGYIVLRAIAPGGTFDRLTPEPIRETTYIDTTAKPGVRYIYSVAAVDSAVPPNVSAASNKVEVVAR